MMGYDTERSRFLANIAPHLTADTLSEAVRYGQLPAPTEGPRGTVIEILARDIPKFLLPAFVLLTRDQYEVRVYIDVLHIVSSRADGEFRESIQNELSDAYARYLSGLAGADGQWPGAKFFEHHANLFPDVVVMQAWQLTGAHPSGEESAAKESLTHRLSDVEKPRGYGEIVAAATRIRDQAEWALLALDLLGRQPNASLSAAVRSAVLRQFPRYRDDFERRDIWRALLRLHAPTSESDLLASARTFRDPYRKFQTLLSLVDHLPADRRKAHYDECLTIAGEIPNASMRLTCFWQILGQTEVPRKLRILNAMLEAQRGLPGRGSRQRIEVARPPPARLVAGGSRFGCDFHFCGVRT